MVSNFSDHPCLAKQPVQLRSDSFVQIDFEGIFRTGTWPFEVDQPNIKHLLS